METVAITGSIRGVEVDGNAAILDKNQQLYSLLPGCTESGNYNLVKPESNG